MRAIFLLATWSVAAAAAAEPAAPAVRPPVKAHVNGVDLHFVDRGRGEPIVFVHGGLMDYREWAPVAEELSSAYRTITYSRRYNFPNDNPLRATDHSALVEAADLAALNRHLRLGRMHVVGVSYGAFLVDTWQATGRAFRAGNPAEAMRVTLDYFVGPGGIDRIPEEFRTVIFGNIREWQALTTSTDAFPPITREQVRALSPPVLMLSGGRTYPMLALTDAELERQLRKGRRKVVADGTHDVCSEQPPVCAAAIRAFLDEVR